MISSTSRFNEINVFPCKSCASSINKTTGFFFFANIRSKSLSLLSEVSENLKSFSPFPKSVNNAVNRILTFTRLLSVLRHRETIIFSSCSISRESFL